MKSKKLRKPSNDTEIGSCIFRNPSANFINSELSNEDQILVSNLSSKNRLTAGSRLENNTKRKLKKSVNNSQQFNNQEHVIKKGFNQTNVKADSSLSNEKFLQSQKENVGLSRMNKTGTKMENSQLSHNASLKNNCKKNANFSNNLLSGLGDDSSKETLSIQHASDDTIDESLDIDSILNDLDLSNTAKPTVKNSTDLTSLEKTDEKSLNSNAIDESDDQIENVEYSVKNPNLQPSYFLFHSTSSLDIDNLISVLDNEKQKINFNLSEKPEDFDDLKQIIQNANKPKNNNRIRKKNNSTSLAKNLPREEQNDDLCSQVVRNTMSLINKVKNEYKSSIQSGLPQQLDKATNDNTLVSNSSAIQLCIVIDNRKRVLKVSTNSTFQQILSILSDDLPELLPGERHAFKFDGISLELNAPISTLYLVDNDNVQYFRAGNSYEYMVDKSEDDGKIVLNLRMLNGQQHAFRIHKKDQLKKLHDAIVKKLNSESLELKLSFDGDDLDINLTPEDYDMEPEDMIDVLISSPKSNNKNVVTSFDVVDMKVKNRNRKSAGNAVGHADVMFDDMISAESRDNIDTESDEVVEITMLPSQLNNGNVESKSNVIKRKLRSFLRLSN